MLVVDGFRNDFLEKKITPCLYNLSKKGMYFNKAYSLGPWSPPAVKGLFTSSYPLMCNDSIAISSDSITIAKLLKTYNYKTGAFVMGGWLSPFFGFDKGFDKFLCVLGAPNKSLSEKIKTKIGESFPKAREFYRRLYLKKNIEKAKGRENDKNQLKNALEFIKENKKEKLFIYIHLEGSHEPYCEGAPTEELINANCNLLKTKEELNEQEIKTIRNLYAFDLNRTDKYIDEFIKKLKEDNLLDNTYLIVFGDHGKMLYEKGFFGHTPDFYEENIHVPLMILGNEIEPKTISTPVSFLDLSPTILDILKIKKPESFFGESLLKFKRKYFFSEDARKRDGRFVSGIENLKYDLTIQGIAIIHGDYKYIHKQNGKDELFNLKNDPKEKENIINSDKEISEKLKNLILNHIKFEEKTRKETEDAHILEKHGF